MTGAVGWIGTVAATKGIEFEYKLYPSELVDLTVKI